VRWILDIIAVLTLAGLIAAVVMFQRVRRERESQVVRTTTELRRLEREIKFRAVTNGTAVNEVGWPVTVEPSWFEHPPVNNLVTAERPWLEVAPVADADLLHPHIRVTIDEKQAGFWYNPFQGVVRARVPVLVSDKDAAELYNRVNGTSLSSLFEAEAPKRTAAGEELGATAGSVSGSSKTTTKRSSSSRAPKPRPISNAAPR
jgi:hypothetical protein